MKKLKKTLDKLLNEEYNLKYKNINLKEKYSGLQVLLNDTLKEDNYIEYLELTIIKILKTLNTDNKLKYYQTKIELVEENVFNYDNENSSVYKANIYRLTVKLK